MNCKQEIIVGSYVQWISQGVAQFDHPRQVLGISEDTSDFPVLQYAFVEGSKTGIPFSELTIEES